MTVIKQGDQYSLPIALRFDGDAVDSSDIDTIELYFGKTRYTYPGDLTYTDGIIYLPLTQEITLALKSFSVSIDLRVKFANGDVVGIPEKLRVTIADATSEEVL